MNRTQKIAWFLAITISFGFILSCIAVAILYAKVGMPKALAGFAFMGIVGLAGFSPLIFGKDKGKVVFDERDRLIKRRASLAGFGAFFIFSYGGMILMSLLVGWNGLISVHSVGTIFGVSAIAMWAAWSVAILVQYGWGSKDGEK